MRIEYDTVHDLLNIEFLANVSVDDSMEADGIVIDYARNKRVIAIEVLDASKRTSRDAMDLTDLTIVRATSSRSDVVGERRATYRKKRKRQG